MKIIIKLDKPRNAVAKAVAQTQAFKPKVVRDKTKYSRKEKHKQYSQVSG